MRMPTSSGSAQSMAMIGSEEGLRDLLAHSPHVDAPAVARDVRLASSQGDDIESDLRRLLKTTAFRLIGSHKARLQGSDTSHHRVDPSLRVFADQQYALRWLRASGPEYDLCCDDSWSGFFIARQLAIAANDEPLTIIHADDHMDMGPTLLAQVDAVPQDPIADRPFDPANSADWEMSIVSGAVGIGNFITPLLFQSRLIHIRHLCESMPTVRPVGLQLVSIRDPLVPDLAFVSPRHTEETEGRSSYARSAEATELCKELPLGRLIVHIDLDYFVNDFNGNAGSRAQELDDHVRCAVLHRMDRLFDAITATNRPVARWVVATSPGFCAFRHWGWLLKELGDRIDASPRVQMSS